MTVLTIIAEWPKNSRETVRVSLDQYQDRDTIDAITAALGLEVTA